jgi:peptidoglycan-N-acetylglucosamine deacetylase
MAATGVAGSTLKRTRALLVAVAAASAALVVATLNSPEANGIIATSAIAATEMAVTVDDLPAHGPLPRGATRLAIAAQMIQALRQHAVPDVYGFANGKPLRSAPELEGVLRAWRQVGFLLGNHTFSHSDLTRVSTTDYIVDIEANEKLLARLVRPGSPKYFRYPYLHEGNTRAKRKAIREWLAARGYTIAQVTVTLEDDWAWNDVYARCVELGHTQAIARLKGLFIETAMARLAAFEELSVRLFKRPIKHILVAHISAFEALTLGDLLVAYRAAGARFISLQEAVQDSAYTIDPGIVGDGGRTFLAQVANARHVPIPDALSRSPEELATLCRS